MTHPLQLGLVGFGRVAEHYYLPAIARLEMVALRGVTDPSEERRALAAEQAPGCRTYADTEMLVSDPEIAAIVIASPPEHHLDNIDVALDAGKPILVEKPLAASIDGVLELAARIEEQNQRLQIGFNRRHWPPAQALRQLLMRRDRAIPARVHFSMCSDTTRWNPISDRSDPLLDLGSHQLDLLRFLFDEEIHSVAAHWQRTGTSLLMKLETTGGIMAECVLAHGGASHERLAVDMEGQSLRADALSERIWPARGVRRWALDRADALGRRLQGRQPSLLSTFDYQLSAFAEALLSGEALSPNVHDGVGVMQALEAARLSLNNEGREVVVAEHVVSEAAHAKAAPR